MPKNRNYRKNQQQQKPKKQSDIQKKEKSVFEERKPDDQKSLVDRLTNQDAKVREMAYITLSTIEIKPNHEVGKEIFSTIMTEKVVAALSDPIRKNALCVFGAISNILTAADLSNRGDVLENYFQYGLLDTLSENVIKIGQEITENWEKMHNSDVEKSLLYVESAFRLLDTLVLLESICVEDNLDFISKHDTLLEVSIQILTSQECAYIKKTKIWANEAILYWISHFLYSLTKENPKLCAKLSGVKDLEEYIVNALDNLDDSNLHICANLSGLSLNLCFEDFKKELGSSQVFTTLVQIPLSKILIGMNSPQYEFTESFAENLEHIKGALSSNNEEEESITNETKPSNTKLAQMLSDFLNEMSTQVRKWKNFSLGNITALEIYNQILSDKGM